MARSTLLYRLAASVRSLRAAIGDFIIFIRPPTETGLTVRTFSGHCLLGVPLLLTIYSAMHLIASTGLQPAVHPLPPQADECQFTTPRDGFVSLIEWLTAFVSDTTMALVEDGALLGSRQPDRGNSGYGIKRTGCWRIYVANVSTRIEYDVAIWRIPL